MLPIFHADTVDAVSNLQMFYYNFETQNPIND